MELMKDGMTLRDFAKMIGIDMGDGRDRPDPYSEEGEEFYATHCPDCLKLNAECQCVDPDEWRDEDNGEDDI